MRSNMWIFFLLLVGCAEDKAGGSFYLKKSNSLVLDNVIKEDFFLTFDSVFSENPDGILFVLPNSSCFNCFEYLTQGLDTFYSTNNISKLTVLKNDKIKSREVFYSFRNVIKSDNIEILSVSDFTLIKAHDFYPKVGYIKNGVLSCLEVFEQGDNTKVRNYFNFLNQMVK